MNMLSYETCYSAESTGTNWRRICIVLIAITSQTVNSYIIVYLKSVGYSCVLCRL